MVVTAAEGLKFKAVAAAPGIGTGGLKITPLLWGTGRVNFAVAPFSIVTVQSVVAWLLQIMTEVRWVLMPAACAAIHSVVVPSVFVAGTPTTMSSRLV